MAAATTADDTAIAVRSLMNSRVTDCRLGEARTTAYGRRSLSTTLVPLAATDPVGRCRRVAGVAGDLGDGEAPLTIRSSVSCRAMPTEMIAQPCSQSTSAVITVGVELVRGMRSRPSWNSLPWRVTSLISNGTPCPAMRLMGARRGQRTGSAARRVDSTRSSRGGSDPVIMAGDGTGACRAVRSKAPGTPAPGRGRPPRRTARGPRPWSSSSPRKPAGSKRPESHARPEDPVG